jgi:hypothetical protein
MPTVSARDLRNWRLMEQFQIALASVLRGRLVHRSFSDSGRKLALSDYLSLFLFGLFNPCVRTLRGLCEVSHLGRVHEEICERPVSLGSFSEAQHLLDPGLLEEVFGRLSQAVPGHPPGSGLGRWEWLARDGSLFAALPRMHWALYGGGNAGSPNRAVRLHLSLNILADKPQTAAIRAGKICERKVWRTHWQRGQAYVGDRLFGEEYRVFGELEALDCKYVIRVWELAVVTVEEELPVSEADRRAGVQRQAWVRLGCNQRNQSVRLRMVWVRTRLGNPIQLATNLTPEALSAKVVWLLYKERWKVELFFRWIKCILGCRHWLAESPAGVAIQMYLALIAALLLQLHFGRRPNKRMMELIQLHQMGIATNEELAAGLARQLKQIQARQKA